MLFLVMVFSFGCGEKPKSGTQKQAEVKPFTPPSDGKITEQQKDAYIKASIALDNAMKDYSQEIKDFVNKYKLKEDLSQMSDTTYLKTHPDIKKAWDELNKEWERLQKEAYKGSEITEEEFNWIGGALTDPINANVQKQVEKSLSTPKPETEKKEKGK